MGINVGNRKVEGDIMHEKKGYQRTGKSPLFARFTVARPLHVSWDVSCVHLLFASRRDSISA